eukprot:TRINITY_DN6150_c0_g1_i1.p1 TRINITY_DN6150_c0_g1~~TRINITY_DN6150_c0_g1_i1.p1  ORF type:complete len:327 (+),score=53.19 TRINITY_DN6150_c0_g1_i1:27-983(+)
MSSNYTNVNLTSTEQDIIITVRMFICFLSLIGSSVMLSIMIIFKRYTALSRRLVMYMTMAAFGEAVVNLFTLGLYGSTEALDGFCYVQGILQQFFQIALFMWIAVIALNLYINVVQKQFSANYEKVYLIVVGATCVVLTLIPVLNYGVAGLWCWIAKAGAGNALRFICFYVPLYVLITFVIILYIIIACNLTNERKMQEDLTKEQKKKSKALVRTLIAYPLIFLGLYFFPTINRIQDWVDPENDVFFLYLMHAISAPALGFANSIAYVIGLDPEVKQNLGKFLPCFSSATVVEGTDELVEGSSSFDEIDISSDTTSGQ